MNISSVVHTKIKCINIPQGYTIMYWSALFNNKNETFIFKKMKKITLQIVTGNRFSPGR